MNLYEMIMEKFPELTDGDFDLRSGTILLRNDGDEFGDYIAKWEYAKPLPKSMKIGK